MNIPKELKYSKDHEWVKIDGDIATVGITDFAQNELGELVYIEVETVDETLDAGEIFGTIEAVKTTSDLFIPITGKVIEFNSAIDESEGDDPTLVNSDPYGKGWIIKVKVDDISQLETLLSAEDYEKISG